MQTNTTVAAKKVSDHIQERQELLDSCQRIVCYRLGISPEDYVTQMYKAMHQYIMLRPGFADWPEAREAILTHPIFKSWWKNQWLLRELQFVNSIQRGDTRALLTDCWQWLHNPRVLAGCIHPNSVVLEAMWTEVVGNVVKATTQKEVIHG